MTGYHHTEGIECNSLSHYIRQLLLAVGIGFKDMLDPDPLQYLSNRDCLGYLIEIFPGCGMILVPGHGSRHIFHEHQGQVVFIEQGIDDAGNAGMEEGGITEKSNNLPRIVEQGQSRTDTGGSTHTEQHAAHFIRFLKSQGMAAYISNSNGLVT